MRSLGLSLVIVLAAGCSTPTEPALCDLNELIPMEGGIAVDPQTRELHEVPAGSPVLVPCECEIDPYLRAISERNPVVDASTSFKSGHPKFLGEPGYGLWPVGLDEPDYAFLESVDLKALPGDTEEIRCHEQIRLRLEARSYLEKYNRELLRLVREH